MKLLIIASCVTLAFLMLSCYNSPTDVTVPQFSEGGNFIDQTNPLQQAAKVKLEGIYSVTGGTDKFGNTVVMKISGDRMSIFTGVQSGYFILRSGSLDSVIFFEGFWRHQVSTETGLAALYIGKEEGGKYLLGDTSGGPIAIKIRGNFGDGTSAASNPITFDFVRPLNPQTLASKFITFAHHGFQTSDNMPASENTVEVIRIIERYGANAAELDVRLSKDRIPYLYHDNTLNPRLVQRGPLVGATEDYTMAQLKTFVRLLHGEQIPTVREALEAVLRDTKLNYVWLDSKTTDVQMLKEIVPIQREILDSAAAMGRDLQIVIGLPTDSHITEFLALPDYKNIPCLCELTTDDVINVGAVAWGPRWTRGLVLDGVAQMHALNPPVKVFSWTVDVPGYIQSYLNDGQFDGMISDYPSLVNYYRYTK